MGGKLLIVGDFNIHVDVVGNATACKFLSLHDSHGLTQNVRRPTHLDGQTLDLVILCPSDNAVSDYVVTALIEDHFAILVGSRSSAGPATKEDQVSRVGSH